MVGKLLSIDLAKKGVTVVNVHVRLFSSAYSPSPLRPSPRSLCTSASLQPTLSVLTLYLSQPGFMRTEMTANIGYDQYWDAGGAVEPPEAATSLLDFAEKVVGEEHNGQFWAPRGPR
jgi:hypothetical protein